MDKHNNLELATGAFKDFIKGYPGVSHVDIMNRINEENSTQTSPWTFDDVCTIVSDEPLGAVRHILDERVLRNLDRGGVVHLAITKEKQEQGRLMEKALALGEITIASVNLGSYNNNPDNAESKLIRYLERNCTNRTQVNVTSGNEPLRDILEDFALGSEGASIVKLASSHTEQLKHKHGTRGTGRNSELRTDWSRIGIEGLLQVFGFKYKRGRSNSEIVKGQVQYTNADLQNDLEEQVKQAVLSSPVVDIAGIGVSSVQEKTKSETEMDAIGIKRGKLFIVEAKNCGDNSVANGISKAMRQHITRTPRTKHVDRYIVIPQDPEDLITTLHKSKIHRDNAQRIESAVLEARAKEINVVGIDQFTEEISI